MENWAAKNNSKIDSNLESAREKDIRFFRIDEFKRNITRVNEFSADCSFCKKQKIDISEVAETIFEAVDVPGNKRREYDRLISRLSVHMRKKHGFYPPFYFSYLYAFFGFIGGFILGFLLYLIFRQLKEAMFAIGFMIGIVAAYILGSRKDHKIRSAKKLM